MRPLMDRHAGGAFGYRYRYTHVYPLEADHHMPVLKKRYIRASLEIASALRTPAPRTPGCGARV